MALRRQPMNKVSGADMRRLSKLPFLKARLKVCLFARVGYHLPCLRLHCLCLVRWRQSNYVAAGVRTTFMYLSICLCQLRIHLIRDGRDIGQQQAEIQSIQILLQDPEARSSEAFAVVHQHPRRLALK